MPLPSLGRLGSRTNLKPVRSTRHQQDVAGPAVEAEDKELTSYLAALSPDRDDPETTGSGLRFGESQVHQVRLNRIASQQLRDLASQRQLSVQELTQEWILDRLSWEGQTPAGQTGQDEPEPQWEQPAPVAVQAEAGWQQPDWDAAQQAGGYPPQDWPPYAEQPGRNYPEQQYSEQQYGEQPSHSGQQQYAQPYGQPFAAQPSQPAPAYPEPYQQPYQHGNAQHGGWGEPQYQGQLLTHADQPYADEQPYGNGVYATEQDYRGPSYGAAQNYPAPAAAWDGPVTTEARQNAARVQAWHGGARGQF